jgi:hypothetical protein
LAVFSADRALFAPGSLLRLFNGSRQLTATPPVVETGTGNPLYISDFIQ